MTFLPSDESSQLNSSIVNGGNKSLVENSRRRLNFEPLVRSKLSYVKLPVSTIDYYQKARELFNSGGINPEEWAELSVIDDTLNRDFSAKLSKVKDPYIRMIRQSFESGALSSEEASQRLNDYRNKRLSAKARDVLADTQDSTDMYDRLDELAILDEGDKQALMAIIKIISSDLNLKEQLLGVASLISNRDVQVIFYLLIIEPKMVIDLVDSMSSAISQLVLKIFIRLIKYVIKKLKSALSFW